MFFSRLFSTVVLIAIFFCVFFLRFDYIGLIIFTVGGILLTLASVKEVTEILLKIDIKSYFPLTAIFSLLIFLGIISKNIFINAPQIEIVLCGILAILAWFFILFSNKNKDVIHKLVGTLSIILLFAIPLNFITIIYTTGYGVTFSGVNLVLFLVLVTKCGDIGAYCTGTLCSKRASGNHKIVPNISPKKSWEGTIGGAIFSVIIAVLLAWFLGYNLFLFGVFGFILFIFGFCGDLSESVLKRVSGVKDSGSVIPGIGGTLDLVDSLVINAPLFYILLKIFNIL